MYYIFIIIIITISGAQKFLPVPNCSPPQKKISGKLAKVR